MFHFQNKLPLIQTDWEENKGSLSEGEEFGIHDNKD